MTKFEMMMTIFFSIHLFFELAMIGCLNRFLEVMSKGEYK